MSKDLQHSINYIKGKIGGNSGFYIPERYFDDFENKICEKLSEEKRSKKTPFEVPEHYFATLEESILTKISSEGKKLPKKKTAVISLRKLVPFAAAIAFFFLLPFLNNSDTAISIDSISIAEIENWYENNYNTANDINELAILLSDNDFNEAEALSINFDEQTLNDYFNSVETPYLTNIHYDE